jgi:hypothetical protein
MVHRVVEIKGGVHHRQPQQIVMSMMHIKSYVS